MSISLSKPDNGPIFLTPNDPLIEGVYAIERGMLVRIGNVTDADGSRPQCEVSYVHHRYDGEVTSGGASMWHDRSSLTVVSSPRHVLLAFADHARRMKAQAEQDAVNADRLYASAKLALNAMKLAAEIAANPSTSKES